MNHFIPVLTGYFLRYISGSYVSLASAGFRKEPFLGNGKGMVAQISLRSTYYTLVCQFDLIEIILSQKKNTYLAIVLLSMKSF